MINTCRNPLISLKLKEISSTKETKETAPCRPQTREAIPVDIFLTRNNTSRIKILDYTLVHILLCAMAQSLQKLLVYEETSSRK